MPEMSGIEFCKMLRQYEKENFIKKTHVIGTKDSDDPEENAYMAAGMD